MSASARPEDTARSILAGDVRAAARLMRAIDDGLPGAASVLGLLHPHTGRAWLVGVTGSPGVGKSSLTDALVGAWRARGLTVGVVAVDPTSPFSGGAILGDRIRMQQHACDPGVFIRSLATRGQFGGLTASTRGVAAVLDAMGKDVILIETVGVGQDEVEIARMADTTAIVVVPGMGDDIQAIKAGVLEAGDVFVVNKMDREGAGRTAGEIEAMLSLGGRGDGRDQGWTPPVVLTCAVDGRGLPELVAAFDRHRAHLLAEGGWRLAARRGWAAQAELLELVKARLMQRVQARLDQDGLAVLAQEIAQKRRDPYQAADQILAAAMRDTEEAPWPAM
ncbi:MAG: methylmalonyl Co-A mutase-associated GTPase MeaB [Desulfarculus sp.]|nr:methylmalonyl Co-A mutase-associated GTPase MeaB [Desulfarculus sp.]